IDTNLHRSMFRKHNIRPACHEVVVDRSTCSKCAHCNSQGLRMYGCADYDANHLEATGSAFGTVYKIIFMSGCSQTDRNPASQVPGLGRLGLCSALGIQLDVISCARLDTLEHRFYFRLDPVGQHQITEDESKLPIAFPMPRWLDLHHASLQYASFWNNQF